LQRRSFVRLSRLFSRQRPDLDELAARCAAADRIVAERVAALARAGDRHLAAPDSAQRLEELDAAEELLFIAEHEQRQARDALHRARQQRRFAPSAGTEPSR
jgi:hypothetical protein